MEQLAKALTAAAEIESRLTGTPVDANLRQELTMWGAGIFRLVVMGEIKKGKSSFINAMLGEEELVPTSSDVATSTIYKIRYGREKSYRVHFEKSTGKEALNVNGDELRLYGTEAGNPGNEKQVKFIEVAHPSPVLKSGIVIIDTPGLGGLFRAHKQVTYEYVPRADAVFFVTDSVESPVGALELEYLDDVRNITPHFYFVQTKCNSVDAAARDARKQNNLSILAEHLKCNPAQIPYFLLDSRLRFTAVRRNDVEKLERSGYPRLMSFIANSLQANQHKILMGKALNRMRPTLQNVTDILASRQEVLQAKTQEEKDKLREKLQDAENALRDWQEREQPAIFTRLQEGLQKIRLQALELCGKCRPAGDFQMEYERRIHDCSNMDELCKCAEDIEKELPERCARVAEKVREEVRKETAWLLNNLVPQTSSGDVVAVDLLEEPARVTTRGLSDAAARMDNSSLFDTLRTGLFGGVAGASIASVVGGIVGSVVPVVGTVIGSTVGMAVAGLWGMFKATDIKAQNELRAAKGHVCGEVGKAMSTVYGKLQSVLENLMVEINSRATMAVQEALRQRRNELAGLIRNLRDGGHDNNRELEEQKAALVKERTAFNTVLREVKNSQAVIKQR